MVPTEASGEIESSGFSLRSLPSPLVGLSAAILRVFLSDSGDPRLFSAAELPPSSSASFYFRKTARRGTRKERRYYRREEENFVSRDDVLAATLIKSRDIRGSRLDAKILDRLIFEDDTATSRRDDVASFSADTSRTLVCRVLINRANDYSARRRIKPDSDSSTSLAVDFRARATVFADSTAPDRVYEISVGRKRPGIDSFARERGDGKREWERDEKREGERDTGRRVLDFGILRS